MMLLLDINNNLLISNLYYFSVYQYKYENWELYQEINIYLVEKNQKTLETVVLVTRVVINLWNIYIAHYIIESMMGVVKLST